MEPPHEQQSKLYQMLASLKQSVIDQKQFNLLLETAKAQKHSHIELWKLKPEIRTLFKLAKYQTYLMVFLGLTAIPYTLYYKYTEDPDKLNKILIFAPFAMIASFAPLYFYRRFSKTLYSSLSYNIQANKLAVTQFWNRQQVLKELNRVKYTQSEKGRVQKIFIAQVQNSEGQIKKGYQIQGLGEWESIELFKYFAEQRKVDSL